MPRIRMAKLTHLSAPDERRKKEQTEQDAAGAERSRSSIVVAEPVHRQQPEDEQAESKGNEQTARDAEPHALKRPLRSGDWASVIQDRVFTHPRVGSIDVEDGVATLFAIQ